MKKETYVIFWDYKTSDISYCTLFEWNMYKDRYTNCTSLNISEGKRDLYKDLKNLDGYTIRK